MEGGEKYRALIMEIPTLIKQLFKVNSMLSPLALPRLPNNEVVYTRMSSTSVFTETK